MKKTALLISAITFILFSFKQAPPYTWTFDGAHSNLQFSVTHLMVSEVEGSFRVTEATLAVPNEDFTDASVTMTADVKSIDTDNEVRDEHLQKPDLFDTEKYPVITFKSTSFKKVSADKYSVTGGLTMHGVTKTVTLDAIATLGSNPYDNKTLVGFRVSGTVKRMDFNIANSSPEAMLSNDVVLKANMEFVRN